MGDGFTDYTFIKTHKSVLLKMGNILLYINYTSIKIIKMYVLNERNIKKSLKGKKSIFNIAKVTILCISNINESLLQSIQ